MKLVYSFFFTSFTQMYKNNIFAYCYASENSGTYFGNPTEHFPIRFFQKPPIFFSGLGLLN